MVFQYMREWHESIDEFSMCIVMRMYKFYNQGLNDAQPAIYRKKLNRKAK